MAKSETRITKKEIGRERRRKRDERKKEFTDNFLAVYEERLPGLISTNIKLQAKALSIVEAKLDDANAVQAATIYGILHDKVQTVVKEKGGDKNTVNMFFGDNMNTEDVKDLLGKVMGRLGKEEDNIIDAEFEVSDSNEKQSDDPAADDN